jgi:hypothetical protein
MEMTMKKVLFTTMAAALALSFAASVQAHGNKHASAGLEASCKAQAAKKFSAIHFMKRRNFVNQCVAQREGGKTKHAKAKAKPANAQAAQPSTTGMAPQSSTTGQAPKQPQSK